MRAVWIHYALRTALFSLARASLTILNKIALRLRDRQTFFPPLRREGKDVKWSTDAQRRAPVGHLEDLLDCFCYMWIRIRDHGRLRVPRQTKFLSRKYSVV